MSAGLLLVAVLLAGAGIVEDLLEGHGLEHVIVEAAFFILAILGALYLLSKSNRLQEEASVLKSEISGLHKDSEYWRRTAGNYLRGLGTAIDEQFSRWQLSEAEKDVGLLLLKGLSHKEIADVRETSDKTIRRQAAALYNKADLDGRAQLSAFFLEDLLLPEDQSSTPAINSVRDTPNVG